MKYKVIRDVSLEEMVEQNAFMRGMKGDNQFVLIEIDNPARAFYEIWKPRKLQVPVLKSSLTNPTPREDV